MSHRAVLGLPTLGLAVPLYLVDVGVLAEEGTDPGRAALGLRNVEVRELRPGLLDLVPHRGHVALYDLRICVVEDYVEDGGRRGLLLSLSRASPCGPTSRENETKGALIAALRYQKHAIQTPPAIYQT